MQVCSVAYVYKVRSCIGTCAYKITYRRGSRLWAFVRVCLSLSLCAFVFFVCVHMHIHTYINMYA